jgi:hypothetical protein
VPTEPATPTPEDIDALVEFLPVLTEPGFQPVKQWQGGKRKDGTWTAPYPEYAEVTERFFALLRRPCWLDASYKPEAAAAMIREPGGIGRATMAEIRQLLTSCLRGERFSDGHWAEMIEKGVIRAILERLRQLRLP